MSRGRPKKRRQSGVLFGFRLLWPDGAVKTEGWFDQDVKHVHVVNFDTLSGLPEDAGVATMEQFMTVLEQAREAHHAE